MSFWDRLTGRVVEAAGLGQKKRAAATGILAFDGPLADLRLEVAIKSHPWLQDTATSTLFLSTWAAQALQDMAAVLESAAKEHLGEAGKLPEATFRLADTLYDSALSWIDLAQTALATIDAKTDFVMTLRLPAPAPRLDWVADAPPAHFVAAIQAVIQLGTSVEDALNNTQSDRARLPRRYDGAFESIAGTIRFARAKLDQVQAAESDRQAVRLSRDIWAMLEEVARLYFLAGQQTAMPGLIDRRYDAVAQAAARASRLPPPPAPPPDPASAQRTTAGPARRPPSPARPPPRPQPAPPTLSERLGLRFDAWSLTDPAAKATYQNDRGRIAELEAFWRADTNPDETFRLFRLISAAVDADHVAARPGEFARACPWISTFVARTDVSVGSEQFTTGQLFTLKVGMDGGYFGRGFDRLGFLPGTRPRKTPASGDAAGPMTQRTPSDEEMWRLTAAFQRPQRRANPADADKLRQLWRDDPDPASTLAVHDEVMAAVHAGNVRPNGDEGLRECPWSQVYVAVNRVTIAGVRLERNEKFALEVGTVAGTFRRAISRLGSISSAAVGGA
jgi:hypothetical protein